MAGPRLSSFLVLVDNDEGRVWPDRSRLPFYIFRICPQGLHALRRGVSDGFLLQ